MEARIKPTEEPDSLKVQLEKRAETAEIDDGEIVVELKDASVLARTPGVESYVIKGDRKEGPGGKPVEEPAYARLESREDTVRAFLATIRGYSLVVLDTERSWDLKQLRRYNPDIKHLKSDQPVEELGIEKAIGEVEATDKLEIDMPENEVVEQIYREKLT